MKRFLESLGLGPSPADEKHLRLVVWILVVVAVLVALTFWLMRGVA